MESILSIAGRHNLYVIEDNAQSIGANYTFSDGTVKKAGTIASIGTTSFFPRNRWLVMEMVGRCLLPTCDWPNACE